MRKTKANSLLNYVKACSCQLCNGINRQKMIVNANMKGLRAFGDDTALEQRLLLFQAVLLVKVLIRKVEQRVAMATNARRNPGLWWRALKPAFLASSLLVIMVMDIDIVSICPYHPSRYMPAPFSH